LEKINLGDCASSEREARLRAHEQQETQQAFDLGAGPLSRGKLLRMSSEDHVLLITMHHIISDGWSVEVFARELGALYTAYHEGRGNPLKPLPVQYADYAQWQREWLKGEALERQLSYWKSQLQGATPELQLPGDRPRPPSQSYRGDDVRVVID